MHAQYEATFNKAQFSFGDAMADMVVYNLTMSYIIIQF